MPGTPPMKTPAEFAPTTADMSQILLSVRHAVEAVADHDLPHVVTAGRDQIMCASHMRDASPYGQAGPAAVHPLVVAYREVTGYTNAALSHLNQATLDTATPTQRPGVMVALSILDRRRDPSIPTALFDTPLEGSAPPEAARFTTGAASPPSISRSTRSQSASMPTSDTSRHGGKLTRGG
ncbi:hypothetical protein [Sphaerimonospora thailandensis]|uniref:Uncharacterized protein n=1 Tax=Sphaerimonospora thailandensis TaxID=795644 RepID=A0A8J3RGP0_9ACTN|nr:hypothetical protein [Sphaerimonospora thailandensis]GIH72028.1 hypothetical protein Mth01_42810 [Sphaerimonospora thailandensis]